MQLRAEPRPRPQPPHIRALPPPAARADLSPRAFRYGLLGLLALGMTVRSMIVFAGDFPLNDGGMFYAMARDLQANGYAMPAFTSYNEAGIPFAYPPLGLYAATLLTDGTPMSLLTTFQVLPLLMSAATILAFLALARALLTTRLAVLTAVAIFAFVPRSFLWMIMGGGVTRSLGFFCALVALHCILQMYTARSHRALAGAALFSALTVMSHLEMAWFVLISAAVMFVAYGRDAWGVRASAIVAVATVVLAAPWWATVLAHHGPSPFIAASRTNTGHLSAFVDFLSFDFSAEPLFPLFGALALVGAVACIAARRYFIPLWLLAIFIADPRAFGTVSTVQIALLGAIATTEVILPLARAPRPLPLTPLGGEPEPSHGAPAWLIGTAVACAIAYAALAAVVASPRILTAITPDERAAMAWVAEHTPEDARFLVVTGDRWAVDRTSEWFPVLASRPSVATVQGTEWLPDGAYADQLLAYREAQRCATLGDGDCLQAWSLEHAVDFDYVFIPRHAPGLETMVLDEEECCFALRSALSADSRYALVYDDDAATIYRRLDDRP